MLWLLIIELLAVFVMALLLLHRYGDLRTLHPLVSVATLISWYFCMIIVFILPLDVAETIYGKHEREKNNTSPDGGRAFFWSGIPRGLMPVLWKIVYWSSQILTWIAIPFMQSYACSAAFTVPGKLKSVLLQNAIYMGTYLILFIVFLIYVATLPNVEVNTESLKSIGITASNTWGLVILVVLFGYGLVEVPRSLWEESKPGHSLRKSYFKVAKLSVEKTEADECFEDAMEEVRRVSEAIKYNHPSRKYVDIIVSKCPEEVRKRLRRMDDCEEFRETDREGLTLKALTSIHGSVIQSCRTRLRTRVQWDVLVDHILELEDIAESERNPNKEFISASSSSPRDRGWWAGMVRSVWTPQVEWLWKCRVKPIVLRTLAICAMVLSLMVVWSECLFFIQTPVLSLFAVFVQVSETQPFLIMVISIIVIAYLCLCAYFTVFRIRFFNYYYIATHHMTDEYSLLFSGMLLCRLTPPLCLNFLGLVHLDSHVTSDVDALETDYTKIMGHMDVISFISNGFNIYFPIAIVLLCAATLLSLGSRILHCVGIQQFIGDDDLTEELMEEGRNLIKREKLKMERDGRREERREYRRKLENEGYHAQRGPRPPRRQYGSGDLVAPSQHHTGTGNGADDRVLLLSDIEPVDFSPSGGNILDDDTGDRASVEGHSAMAEWQRREGRSRNIFDDI